MTREEMEQRAFALALIPIKKGRKIKLEELSLYEGSLLACKEQTSLPVFDGYYKIERAFRELDIAYYKRSARAAFQYGPYEGLARPDGIARDIVDLASLERFLQDAETYLGEYQKRRALSLDELELVGDYMKIAILKKLAFFADMLRYMDKAQYEEAADPFCLAAMEPNRARELGEACGLCADRKARAYGEEMIETMAGYMDALSEISQWQGPMSLSKTRDALQGDDLFRESDEKTQREFVRRVEAVGEKNRVHPTLLAKKLVEIGAEKRGGAFAALEDGESLFEAFGIRKRALDVVSAYPSLLLLASATVSILAGGIFGKTLSLKILVSLSGFIPVCLLLSAYADQWLKKIAGARPIPRRKEAKCRAVFLMPAHSCARMGQMVALHKKLPLDFAYYGGERNLPLEEHVLNKYGVQLGFYQTEGGMLGVCRALGDAYDFAVFADDSVYFLPDTVDLLLRAASHQANIPKNGLGRAVGGYDAVAPTITACPPKKGDSRLRRIFSGPAGYSEDGYGLENPDQQLFGETFFCGIGVVHLKSGKNALSEENLRTGVVDGAFAMRDSGERQGRHSLKSLLSEYILGQRGSRYRAMCGKKWADMLFPLFAMALIVLSYFQGTWGWLLCSGLAIGPVFLRAVLEFNQAVNQFLMNYKRSAGAKELWIVFRQKIVKSVFDLFLLPLYGRRALTARAEKKRDLWLGPVFGLAQWCVSFILGRFLWYSTILALLFLATPLAILLLAKKREKPPEPMPMGEELFETIRGSISPLEAPSLSIYQVCSHVILAMIEEEPGRIQAICSWLARAERQNGLYHTFYDDGGKNQEGMDSAANGILACLLLAFREFLQEKGYSTDTLDALLEDMDFSSYALESGFYAFAYGEEAKLFQTRMLPCYFAALALGKLDYQVWKNLERLMIRRKMFRGLISQYGGADEYFFPLFDLFDDTLLQESQSTASRLQRKGGGFGSGGFLAGQAFIENGKAELGLFNNSRESVPTPYAPLLMAKYWPSARADELARPGRIDGEDSYSAMMALLGYEDLYLGRLREYFWKNEAACSCKGVFMEIPSPNQLIIKEYANQEPV